MALIPYAHLPIEKDPPLVVAGTPLQEFFCGDARCDCATAHVVLGGVGMTVDLGTRRVDLIEERGAAPSSAKETLRQAVRQALTDETLEKLRTHYNQTREHGKTWHFRYVNWTALKPGDTVSFEQVFRHLGTPIYTLTGKPAAPEAAPASAPAEAAPSPAAPASEVEELRLGLADAYCVEPRCDCGRVMWTVLTTPKGSTVAPRSLGTVEYDLITQEHAVRKTAPGVDANQLYLAVFNLLRARPAYRQEARERYDLLRQQLSPIVKSQRLQQQQSQQQKVVGRNDNCPCGSGKKWKKCHGK